MRSGMGKDLDKAGVACAGLKHLRSARISTGLKIDDEARVLGPGMLGNECRGAEEAVFFSVGEYKEDVIAQGWARAKGAKRFQKSSHAGTIVSSSRAGCDGVIMRGKSQSVRGAAKAFQASDNVFDRACDLIARRDAGGALDLRRHTKISELGNEIVAHAVMLCGADGMGSRCKGVEIHESTLRREKIFRSGCGKRIRGALLQNAERCDAKKEQKNN